MSIQKKEIPILEYDDDPNAVIMPGHERVRIALPEKAVFAFVGDALGRYARRRGPLRRTRMGKKIDRRGRQRAEADERYLRSRGGVLRKEVHRSLIRFAS